MRVCDRCTGKLNVQSCWPPHDEIMLYAPAESTPRSIKPQKAPMDLCETCRTTYHSAIDVFMKPVPVDVPKTYDYPNVSNAIDAAVKEASDPVVAHEIRESFYKALQ